MNRDELRFEWDDAKNLINQMKHGISFQIAKSVFYDDNAIIFDDPEHSLHEERFLIIGIAGNKRLCIVSHCYRDGDNVIRIISAREATKKEKNSYLNQWGG